jgi:hypothetical protein
MGDSTGKFRTLAQPWLGEFIVARIIAPMKEMKPSG